MRFKIKKKARRITDGGSHLFVTVLLRLDFGGGYKDTF